MGSLDGSFDDYNDGKLEGLSIGYSLGSTDGEVLGYDEGTKLGFTDDGVLGTILGNTTSIWKA